MPKLKTNKAAAKRYSYTATGKVKRTKSNRRHLLANKTTRQTKQQDNKTTKQQYKKLCLEDSTERSESNPGQSLGGI